MAIGNNFFIYIEYLGKINSTKINIGLNKYNKYNNKYKSDVLNYNKPQKMNIRQNYSLKYLLSI